MWATYGPGRLQIPRAPHRVGRGVRLAVPRRCRRPARCPTGKRGRCGREGRPGLPRGLRAAAAPRAAPAAARRPRWRRTGPSCWLPGRAGRQAREGNGAPAGCWRGAQTVPGHQHPRHGTAEPGTTDIAASRGSRQGGARPRRCPDGPVGPHPPTRRRCRAGAS